MQRLTVAAAALLSTLSVYSKTAYVSPSGSSTEPYDSPETAATDANVALATLGEGDELVICEGTNEITSQLVVDRNVTIRGESKKSILKMTKTGGDNTRVLNLAAACLVENLTLMGGGFGNDKEWVYGQGVLISADGARLVDCILDSCGTASWHTHGGGIGMTADGVVDRCRVLRCKSGAYSSGCRGSVGGIYATKGVIRNTLVAECRSTSTAGVYLGGTARMENCTVVNCSSYNSSAVVDVGPSARLVNTVVFGNATSGDIGGTAENVSYCCSKENFGSNPVTGDPQFRNAEKDDWRLQASSPCVNAGDPVSVIADGQLDLSGGERLLGERVDLGCYEYDPDAIDLVIPSANQNVNEPMTLSFTTGGLVGYTFAWTVSADEKSYSGTGETFVFTPQETGLFTVRVVATKDGKPPVAAELADAITVREVVYVSPTGSNTAPYDTPAKAATDPAVALASMADGQTMEICIGTTEIASTLVVNKNVTIRGTDREKSILKMKPVSYSKTTRVMLLSSPCLITRLTMTGGQLVNDASESGHGVRITADGAQVVDCIIRDCGQNSWHTHGGGIGMTANGLVDRCRIENCKCGAGQSSCNASGGGVHASKGIVRNTLIDGCWSTGSGAAVLSGTARMENCTVVNCSNFKATAAVSVDGSAIVVNSICYGNQNGADIGGVEANVSYCCTAAGFGSNPLTGDPLFNRPDLGDYSIKASSPCRDAGDSATVVANGQLDLAGNPRIVADRIDIGAYEYDPEASRYLEIVLPSAHGNLNEPMGMSLTTDGLDGYAFAWTVSSESTDYSESGIGETFAFVPQELGVFTVRVVATKSGKTPVTAELKGAVTVHKVVYVSPTGSNVPPYDTPTNAATDPAVALASMVEGQTMELCVGTTEISSQLVVDRNVTIRGADRETSILKMTKRDGGATRVMKILSPCTVTRLTLTGGGLANDATEGGHGIRIEASGAKIIDCTLDSCGAQTWKNYGGGIYMVGDSLVDRCRILNCKSGAYNASCWGSGGGIWASKGTIRNTLISGCKSTGGGGAQLSGTARMENCTVVDCQAITAAGVYVSDTAKLVNCICYGNQNDLDIGGTAANVSYCCSKAGVGSNPVTGDPLFKNAAKGDYRLTGKSPCVNAGDPATVIAEGQTDLAGAKRVSGKIVDIGCYERVTAGLILFFQ